MSNKANQESICTNGTRNTLQSPQGAENRAGTQTLVDTSAEQKARDLYIQAESCHDRAVPPAEQQAAPKAAPGDSLDEALRERDEAEDFINELLDEVLGADRPEWSSAYNRYDAMSDVRERITALHKPAVNKAWGQFQSAMAAPQPAPAPLSEREAFEAWIEKDGGDLGTFGTPPNMHYRNSSVNNAWVAWKARAALAAQEGTP